MTSLASSMINIISRISSGIKRLFRQNRQKRCAHRDIRLEDGITEKHVDGRGKVYYFPRVVYTCKDCQKRIGENELS